LEPEDKRRLLAAIEDRRRAHADADREFIATIVELRQKYALADIAREGSMTVEEVQEIAGVDPY